MLITSRKQIYDTISGLPIHFEYGSLQHMNNQNIKTLNIKRTYSIMHNICFCFLQVIFVIYSLMKYSKRQKETECCSREDMNTCRIVFKMELLFGDADITGLLNAVRVLGLKTIK